MKTSRLICAALAVAALAASAFAMSPPARESPPPGFAQADVVKSVPAAGATMTITAETGLGAASALKAYEAKRAAQSAPVQRASVICYEEDEAAPVVQVSAPRIVAPDEPRVIWRLHWLRT